MKECIEQLGEQDVYKRQDLWFSVFLVQGQHANWR